MALSLNNNLEVDARKINSDVSNRQTDNIQFHQQLDDVIHKLSHSDLKSFFFLLLDFDAVGNAESSEQYIILMQKSKEFLQERLRTLFRDKKFGKAVLFEILVTLKKFQMLKLFGVCKHRFLEHQNQCSFNFWKALYFVCESLDDEEAQKIKTFFKINNSTITSLEEVLCFLIWKNMLKKKNLSELNRALESIGRPDVVSKLHSMQNENRNYHIRKPSSSNPCGLAIVINQEIFQKSGHLQLKDRLGSHIDRDKLRSLWECFGFDVQVYENLKSNEVLKLFHDISSRENMNYDAFVACILSHGEKDVIYGSDCIPIRFADLVDSVANHCPHFLSKPKFFFIQACQGKDSQSGIQNYCAENNYLGYQEDAAVPISNWSKQNHCLPELVDVYQAIATIPGYVSYRSPQQGSIYVKELIEVLEEYGDKEDIDSCMKRVNNNMSKNTILGFKQMPVTISTLRFGVVFKRL